MPNFITGFGRGDDGVLAVFCPELVFWDCATAATRGPHDSAFSICAGALREDADFTLYRGWQHGNPSPVLAVALAAEQPSFQSFRRLEHEYSLQPNSIPRGSQASGGSLVTKGGQSSFLRTLAVSRWIGFLGGTKDNRSI
jgi:hypothetical protein